MNTESKERASQINSILLERYPEGIKWTEESLNDLREIFAFSLDVAIREARRDEHSRFCQKCGGGWTCMRREELEKQP